MIYTICIASFFSVCQKNREKGKQSRSVGCGAGSFVLQDPVEGWNGVRFWFYVIRSFNFNGVLVQLIHVRN